MNVEPVSSSRWMRGLLLSLVIALAAPAASADLQAHLTLTIAGQAITGGSTQAGREGTIEVPAFSFPGFSPVLAGGAVGAAQSRPVTFTKEIDQSSPLLLQAWANAALVDSAVFRFYRPTQTGQEENFLTITLTNGQVSSLTSSSPNSNDPALLPFPATEHVSFTYQTVTWTFEPTGTSVTRAWQNGQ